MLTTTFAAIQTILCTFLPPASSEFNISLENVPAVTEVTHPVIPPTASKVIKQSQIAEADYRIKTIVLDAGHGGHDPGCLGANAQEKNLALGIALKVRDLITAQFPDIKVIMTRDADFFVPLYERAAIANRANADLFISIHCNFMPGSSATKGTETYVMGLHTAEHNLDVAKRENAAILLEDNYEQNYDFDPNSPEAHIMLSMFQNAHLEQSILLAETVEGKFKTQASRKSRGVRQAGFVVLKATTMPSVLIETGFLSSQEEEGFLNQEEGQLTMANSIFSAFSDYKNTMEYGISAPPVAVQPQPEPVKSQPVVNVPPPSKTTTSTVANRPKQTTEKPVNTAPTEVFSEPKVIPIGNTNNVGNAPIVQFCIQLAAASRPVDASQSKWNNLPYLIEAIQESDMYKYQVRGYTDLETATRVKSDLKNLGFPDAFIVAYKNGTRISVDEAKRALESQY